MTKCSSHWSPSRRCTLRRGSEARSPRTDRPRRHRGRRPSAPRLSAQHVRANGGAVERTPTNCRCTMTSHSSAQARSAVRASGLPGEHAAPGWQGPRAAAGSQSRVTNHQRAGRGNVEDALVVLPDVHPADAASVRADSREAGYRAGSACLIRRFKRTGRRARAGARSPRTPKVDPALRPEVDPELHVRIPTGQRPPLPSPDDLALGGARLGPEQATIDRAPMTNDEAKSDERRCWRMRLSQSTSHACRIARKIERFRGFSCVPR